MSPIVRGSHGGRSDGRDTPSISLEWRHDARTQGGCDSMEFKRWAKTALLAGAILFVLIPSRAPAAEETKAIDDYNFAAWLYNSGKYAMAAESYQNFLKNYADHEKAPDARFGIILQKVLVGD